MDNNQNNNYTDYSSYDYSRSQYRENDSAENGSIQYESSHNAYEEPAEQSAPAIRLDSSGEVYAEKYTQKKQALNPTVRGIIIGIALAVLLAGLVAGIMAKSLSSDEPENITQSGNDVTLQISPSPVTDTHINANAGKPLTYAQVAAKVGRAVVSVNIYQNAYGWGSYIVSEGSGFILSTDGYIVTNSHVIQDENHSKFKITVNVLNADGSNSEYEVDVIGFDTRTDLAVLKLKENVADLVTVELGDSKALVLGDEVVAIGNPGGVQFAGSVTNGIVSGIDRIIDDSTSESAMKYLQTNAAINPGNSGGPLLNMYGQVIGINTAKIVADGYEGLGFAIPMDVAKPLIEQLIENGTIIRPIIGISEYTVITEQMAEWYDVPVGIMVRGISPYSKLSEADVRVGDIITACNGEKITTIAGMQEILEKYNVGDSVTVTIFRSGESEPFDTEIVLIADNIPQETAQTTTPDIPVNPFFP